MATQANDIGAEGGATVHGHVTSSVIQRVRESLDNISRHGVDTQGAWHRFEVYVRYGYAWGVRADGGLFHRCPCVHIPTEMGTFTILL